MSFSSQSHSAIELVLSEGPWRWLVCLFSCDGKLWLWLLTWPAWDVSSRWVKCMSSLSLRALREDYQGKCEQQHLSGWGLTGREGKGPTHSTPHPGRHDTNCSALPCSSCHNGRKTKSQNTFCLLSSCYVSYSVTTMRLHLIHSNGWVFSCQLSVADSFASLSLPKA